MFSEFCKRVTFSKQFIVDFAYFVSVLVPKKMGAFCVLMLDLLGSDAVLEALVEDGDVPLCHPRTRSVAW